MKYLLLILISYSCFLRAGGNPLADGYYQRTNPLADGYIQDTNPLADGYVQDKSLFGFDEWNNLISFV